MSTMNPPDVTANDQTPSYPAPPPNSYPSNAAATAAAALSQQNTLTSNGNGTNSKKRRASGVPGSRGVANLTPDQLAKKRANDREAQRAIRERTRDRIERLEQRIKELESQQPFQELQKALAERDRALAECDALRKKLADVASVLEPHQPQQSQPNLHGTSDSSEQFTDYALLTQDGSELAALTAQQSPLPPLQPQTTQQNPHERSQLHPDLRSPHQVTQPSPVGHTATSGSTSQSDSTTLRRWSPSLDQLSHSRSGTPTGSSFETRLPRPTALLEQSHLDRHGLSYVLQRQQYSTDLASKPEVKTYTSPVPEKPIFARLPYNAEPSCPVDSLLVGFLAGRQALKARGYAINEVAGPEEPYVTAMLYPEAVNSNRCHAVSALLVELISKFPDLKMLSVKVSTLYMMFLMLRWQICPCESCYNRLPDFVKPLQEQLETMHPAWQDHIVW